MIAILPGMAMAQFTGHPTGPRPAPGSYRIVPPSDTTDVRERIGDGRRSGQLNRTDARRLRREAAQLDTLGDRYGANGLSDAEARELQTRALVLRDQVDARRTRGFGGAPRQRGR